MQTVPAPFLAPGVLQIEDYEDINFILRNSAFRVPADRFPDEISGDVLNALHGSDHSTRRRLEYPLFSSSSLAQYEQNMLQPLIKSFSTECRTRLERGEVVQFDLVQLALKLITQVASSIIGLDNVQTDADTSDLVSLVKRMAAGQNVNWIVDKDMADEVLRSAHQAQAEFRERFVRVAAQQRRQEVERWRAGTLDDAELRHDLLTILYLHWDAAWSEDLPVRESFNYLNAAIGTSTRILCHCFDELTNWLTLHPERRADLADPEFIQASVQETLRMHAVLPAIIREATEDVRLPSGHTVARQQIVALLVSAANKDQSLFGRDSQQFDPDRYYRLPLGRAYGLAFGAGPHMCMGRRFAVGGAAPEDSQRTNGTVPSLVAMLLHLGFENKPEEVRRASETYYDEFVYYPVILEPRH